MDGIDACYHFAGFLGLEPRGKTLRTLWRLATGRSAMRRVEMVEQAMLVWSMGDMDIARYVLFGEVSKTDVGGQVKLSPDLEAKVEAEVERIQKENDELPKPGMALA